jgi:flagellar biosynthesis protein FlhG
MGERSFDQADGLRRMFSGDRLRIFHIIAGCAGVGRLSVAIHLGLALAKTGHDALLVEVSEDSAPGRALGRLGLEPRAAAQRGRIASSIVPAPHGLGVLGLSLEMRQLPAQVADLQRYCASQEFALVTATSTAAIQLLPIEASRREVIVVLSRAATSITEAYALIKKVSFNGACRRFHVLVNRVASEREAALIYRNMARVARGYLDVELAYLGFIPADPALEQASALRRNVLDGWPHSEAALAFKKLAQGLAGWSGTGSAWVGDAPRQMNAA